MGLSDAQVLADLTDVAGLLVTGLSYFESRSQEGRGDPKLGGRGLSAHVVARGRHVGGIASATSHRARWRQRPGTGRALGSCSPTARCSRCRFLADDRALWPGRRIEVLRRLGIRHAAGFCERKREGERSGGVRQEEGRWWRAGRE
nr:unnamed protein product [Digitaria exilis]